MGPCARTDGAALQATNKSVVKIAAFKIFKGNSSSFWR
jgi:hypothetical protein